MNLPDALAELVMRKSYVLIHFHSDHFSSDMLIAMINHIKMRWVTFWPSKGLYTGDFWTVETILYLYDLSSAAQIILVFELKIYSIELLTPVFFITSHEATPHQFASF